MADVQILAPGVKAAPLDYVIPGTQEILCKCLFANFDGTAAAAAFYPAIQLISPAGKVVGTYVPGTTVAAGGSASVSWAPFLGRGPVAGTVKVQSVTSIAANTAITGTSAAQQTIITIPTLTFDGLTAVLVEIDTTAELGGAVGTIRGLVIELWDSINGGAAATLGRLIEYFDTGEDANIVRSSLHRGFPYTPVSGTHDYTLRAWRSNAANNVFVNAGPPDLPTWARVTSTT